MSGDVLRRAAVLEERAYRITERAERRWWWPWLTASERRSVTNLLAVASAYRAADS